jgi:hypothetical protein
VKRSVFVVASVLLPVGILLLAANWWLQPTFDAERAMRNGNAAGAAEAYAIAHRRFERMPFSKSVLSGVYRVVIANELPVLYSLRRYDEIVDKASTEEDNEAAPFWAGCALFDEGLLAEKPESRAGLISQSHQEFRRALDLAPDDWDAKFNYELTGKLISGLQKQPQTTKENMMKLLREAPKEREPPRKVG